jgi:peptidoglycan/xylan/chitin deacetylase (PgdA/CDA1 family)
MWYPVKNPRWVKWMFPKMLWEMSPSNPPKLYLSFDDGPIPEVTPWVLEQLAQYDAKATFFCIGRNLERHPDIYEAILAAGHQTGNHTYNHLNGWKTNTNIYMQNVEACAKWVDSKLFRPPYGRLRPKQRQELLANDYLPVMWDVIAGDFDQNIDGPKCLNNILKHTKNGSIVVLHDSKKAWPRLEYVLPKLLAHFKNQGFEFAKIPNKF